MFAPQRDSFEKVTQTKLFLLSLIWITAANKNIMNVIVRKEMKQETKEKYKTRIQNLRLSCWNICAMQDSDPIKKNSTLVARQLALLDIDIAVVSVACFAGQT